MGGVCIMDDKKLRKKLKRKMAQVLSRLPDWDIQFSTEPITTLFIGNAGIQTGVDEILLKQLVTNCIQIYLYIYMCDISLLLLLLCIFQEQ